MRVLDIAQEHFMVSPVGNGVWKLVTPDDSFSSVRIWEDTNSWHRFSTSTGGGPREFMLYILGMPHEDVDRLVPAESINPVLETLNRLKMQSRYGGAELGEILGQKMYHPYLQSRNVNEDTARHYELEVRENAIVFPITDIYGKRIGSQFRFFHGKNRYGFLYLGGYEKPPLWPIKNWDIDNNETIILTEGNFSLLRIHQVLNGRFTNTKLCTLHGSTINTDLIKYLFGKNVIYLGDNDDAGKKAVDSMRDLSIGNFQIETYLPTSPLDEVSDGELLAFMRNLYRTTKFKVII